MADERDDLDKAIDIAYDLSLWATSGHQSVRDSYMQTIDSARSIRARERKLAELAREIHEWLVIQNDLSPIDRDWLKRYEEAVK